jgi:signal peptide peptidase SppA
MYAWVDPNKDANTKAAYKFPHHNVANGKPGAANAAGVRAALSRVAQQGTNIPDGDRGSVRSHLQKHLDKFNAGRKQGEQWTEEDEFILSRVAIIQAYGRTWAIEPELLPGLEHLHGHSLSDAALASFEAAKPPSNGVRPNAQGTAVIPLKGMISPSMSLLTLLMGGSSLLSFRKQMREAVANPEITSIVMNVDSPGGYVDMVPEVARQLRQMAQQKPIVAVANQQMASAAYWLGSQATEVVVTDSGELGSIGVYQIHKDISQNLAMKGISPTIISAGRYKVDGNPYQPLSESAHEDAQHAVDTYYGMFTADVAKGRRTSQEAVQNGYGEGRQLLAKDAVKAGLADRVDTLEATVRRMGHPGALATLRQKQEAAHDPDEDNVVPFEPVEPVAITYSADDRNRLVDTLARLR